MSKTNLTVHIIIPNFADNPGVNMEDYSDKINTFVRIFENLPKIARPEAIKQLVGTLDSDEMDMMIEVIDTKIDDTTNHAKCLLFHSILLCFLSQFQERKKN